MEKARSLTYQYTKNGGAHEKLLFAMLKTSQRPRWDSLISECFKLGRAVEPEHGNWKPLI
jgi:hypothetical protein